MSWTNPKSWGTEVATSADMNDYVGSNTAYLYDNMALANQWIGGTVNVAQLNQRIESGTIQMAVTTASYGSIVITFNTAFGSAPRVIAAATGTIGAFVPRCQNIGTGNFNLHIISTGGTYTGTLYSHWLAIGA